MKLLYLIPVLFVLVWGCHKEKRLLILSESDTGLSIVGSNLVYNGKNFSGVLFRLHDLKKDTIYRVVYKDGKKDGCERIWCAQHQLCEERIYKEGLLDGVQRQWYPSGRSKTVCVYRENILDGKRMEWSENGVLQKQLSYKKGTESGLQQGWNEKGELMFSYDAENRLNDQQQH